MADSDTSKPDLGQPASYLVLSKGAEVYSCDGKELGKVEEVLAEPELDLFDGVILDTSVLPGGHRFVDADQVEEIFERGVLLKLDAAAAEGLPEPTQNAAAMEADPTDEPDSRLEQKLHRAWELLSGKEPKG
jgi:uncharacterized protein YrrD